MPMWTVHSKVREPDAIRTRANEVRFVAEGFNWPAFLVPLLWLIVKGMWLVLVFALAAEMAIMALGVYVRLSDTILTVLSLGLSLIMGFAGNDLYRWTLARGGFHEIGLAAGSDLDEAELRYFSALPVKPIRSLPPAILSPPTPAMPDALGLFPQSSGTR
jgi:hypothetical protein